MQPSCLPLLEVWDGEEDLHGGVEVTAVAQVPHSCVTGAVQGTQLAASFLYHVPLAHLLVYIYLQLHHSFLCLKKWKSVEEKDETGQIWAT